MSDSDLVVRRIYARAPVRHADLSGWLDTRMFQGTRQYVCNMALATYAHVVLEVINDGNGNITIDSFDTNQQVTYQPFRSKEYEGTLDLFRAAFHEIKLPTHQQSALGTPKKASLRLCVRSDAPAGSGLGTSAALGVAVLGALQHLQMGQVSRWDVVHQAHRLETELLGLECGLQDQCASAYGGINMIAVDYPKAHVEPIEISGQLRRQIEGSTLVVYTGKSHFSSNIHRKVIEAFESTDPATSNRKTFEELSHCAINGAKALRNGDFFGWGTELTRNWMSQKKLHPDITAEPIERLRHSISPEELVGFKVNGAGGGGTLTIVVEPGYESSVRRKVIEQGMQILPSLIDRDGLQVWETTRR